MKRLIDLITADMLVLLSLPLMVVAALAIFLEDGHAPFFYQTRIGKNGRHFQMVKFRTMSVPKPGEYRIIEDHPPISDPRVTRIGRILRRTELDDLPNLFNVVAGDISIVGPRPMPLAVDGVPMQAIPGWEARCKVIPGMIGLAQLHCPKRTCLRNKFRYDNVYVHRQCIGTDLYLMWEVVLWIFCKDRRPVA